MNNYPIELKAKTSTFRMSLERPGLIEDHIVHNGGWEMGLVDIISHFIKDDSLFLDIGANIGYHSLYIASMFPNALCYSFEPNPDIYQQLKQNVSINKFKNIVTHNGAVGATNGTTKFCKVQESTYNRGLSAIDHNQWIGNNYEEIEVRIVSLDNFIYENSKQKISLIKIDTEGYEHQVISGALNLITKYKPIICLENHYLPTSGINCVLSLIPDYKIFKIQAFIGEIKKWEEEDPKGYQNDLFCVPKDGPADILINEKSLTP